MDNDALSGLLNDPEALQNALRSVSSLLGASDAGGAPDAVSPADDPEAQLLPVITGIMQSGRAAVRPEKRALLSALRPFVAEDVASQFDRGAPPRRHGRHGTRRAGTARAPRRRRRAFCITVIWPRARRAPHPKRRRYPRSCHRCRALTATRSSRSPLPFFC